MKTGWIFFFTAIVFKTQGQFVVSGDIQNRSGDLIPNVNVVCKSATNSIITYAFSDSHGKYELQIKEAGYYMLEFSSLGFQKQSRPIQLSPEVKETMNIDVVLAKNPIRLNEVILAKDRPIVIKKDTVIFNVNSFARGNEEVVEDLLKSLPNVHVNVDGNITVGNREIEKIMIEGDDFFKRGYKMISKNMPSEPIDKIELIENYTENILLKNISSSNKIALNLKLKENAKRYWFGNLGLGYGFASKNRYELSGILMNFGRKNKYYFYGKLNNTGTDTQGNINSLINPLEFNEGGTIGDGVGAYSLLELTSFPLNFKKKRTNFNNTELISLNAILNTERDFKISVNSLLNLDENEFFRNSATTIKFQNLDFTNSEKHQLLRKIILGFGKVSLDIKPSANESIVSDIRLNENANSSSTDLEFNSSVTREKLKTTNTSFSGGLTYTNRLNKDHVFLLTGRYIYEDIPQYYAIDQLVYPELFPQYSNANNVLQHSISKMNFTGFEAQLLRKHTKGHLLDLKLGNLNRKDFFSSSFSLKEGSKVAELPDSYQNSLEYATNDLYFKTKISRKVWLFSLVGGLDFHYLDNRLGIGMQMQNQNLFFVNPEIGFDCALNKKNTLRANYSYAITNADILDVYDNYVLTGSRSFTRGTGSFNQLDSSNLLISYQFGNWSDKFFVNTVFLYLRNHDFFSSNTFVSRNYSLEERLLIKDRDLLNFNSNLDFFVRPMSSNLKVKLGYTRSNFKNMVNGSSFREIVSEVFNYGIQLRSGFRGQFNFHAGTTWKKTIMSSALKSRFTNTISFLDLSFQAGRRFNLEMEGERYFIGNPESGANTYYFLDFDTRYIVKPNKLEIGLSGNNLFNTTSYRTYSLSDIGSYSTKFRLLPRFLLVELKYRF